MTSIDESLKESFVQAFPNPVVDRVTIETNLPIDQLAVYTLTGEKVSLSAERHRESVTLQLSDLPTGIYLLRVGHKITKIQKI